MPINRSLIWLHEYSLRTPAKLLQSLLPEQAIASCFIWDDMYLREQNYSFKRLVFIYETLIELPVDIIHGDIIDILRQRPESEIYVQETIYPSLQQKIHELQQYKVVKLIPVEPWVAIPVNKKYQRFFQYWKNAEKQLMHR